MYIYIYIYIYIHIYIYIYIYTHNDHIVFRRELGTPGEGCPEGTVMILILLVTTNTHTLLTINVYINNINLLRRE